MKAAWENALAIHSESSDVLHNAGLFFEDDDPQRSIYLFQRALALAPHSSARFQAYSHSLATIYATAALVSSKPQRPERLNSIALTEEAAAQLTAELGASNNSDLLSEVGLLLVSLHHDSAGLAYMQKAVDLDPSNAVLASALESAKAEPVRRQNLATMARSSNSVRLSPSVADANVLGAPKPEYPPLARQAGIEGDVEFSVEIGPDGQIQSLVLVRGTPLLINAAKNAVLGRVYRPVLRNGNPVSVSTNVTVPFRLP